MLLKDSTLLDIFPMSPEPKQEAVEENWNATNLNAGIRVTSDSESEDEDHATDGYMPLSQEPVDGDLLLDEEEVCLFKFISNPHQYFKSIFPLSAGFIHLRIMLNIKLSMFTRMKNGLSLL